MLPRHITEDVMPQILGNVTAMQASRQLGVTNTGLQQAIQRLTTGKRINSAADGATDLANGTSFTAQALTANAQVIGYQQNFFAAQANDSNLQEATNQATRMAELEGTTGGSTSAEYTAVEGLVSAAALAGGLTLTAAQLTAGSAGLLTAIASARSTIAATMATAQSNTNLTQIKAENFTSQGDAVMGADIGAETVNLTKYQILMQAGTSALAQANQSSQYVLALFR
jgi:flagellin